MNPATEIRNQVTHPVFRWKRLSLASDRRTSDSHASYDQQNSHREYHIFLCHKTGVNVMISFTG